MKRFLTFVLVFTGLFHFIPAKVQALELVTSFDSQITINQDTSLAIREKIIYVTDQDKHGIYRYIPYRYAINGVNQTARVTVQSVTDENNDNHSYSTSKSADNLTIKIGDPNQTFSGTQTYVISYRVENAIRQYEDHDELFWDITGEGWTFPIAQTAAIIQSPFAPIRKTICYAGAIGSDNQLCRAVPFTESTALFRYSSAIGYGDNLTVAIDLARPNQLIFPTFWQKTWQAMRDNFSLVLISLPGIIMFGWWWQKGRDSAFISGNVFNQDATQPQSKNIPFAFSRVPMVYEPLKDLTPGEAGTMLDESADNADVVAEILELARKKYLNIEMIETKKFLGKDIEYVFTQLKVADGKLPEVQEYLHGQLFAGRRTIKLSQLKGSFYTTMETAKNMLYDSLTDRKLFIANPKKMKELAFAAVAVMGSLAGYLFFVMIGQGIWLAVPIFSLSILIALLCALKLPARTAIGHNLALQALGLQRSITSGKWRQEIQEKHLFIENIFPFAVALGVVAKLTHDMKALNLAPPSYLNHVPTGMAFHSWVGTFTEQASSSMSYNPSSSSQSGGSGFSGGSSGGGGGGGGGGSW